MGSQEEEVAQALTQYFVDGGPLPLWQAGGFAILLAGRACLKFGGRAPGDELHEAAVCGLLWLLLDRFIRPGLQGVPIAGALWAKNELLIRLPHLNQRAHTGKGCCGRGEHIHIWPAGREAKSTETGSPVAIRMTTTCHFHPFTYHIIPTHTHYRSFCS